MAYEKDYHVVILLEQQTTNYKLCTQKNRHSHEPCKGSCQKACGTS